MSRQAPSAPLLVVGVGNVMRGDDGVGPRVVDLLSGHANLELQVSFGFLPELAPAVAAHDRVVFVDADPAATTVVLEALVDEARSPALGHGLGPGAVLGLARRLYGFDGEAWLCRVPALDLSLREGLSPAGEQAAQAAAAAVLALRAEPGARDRNAVGAVASWVGAVVRTSH